MTARRPIPTAREILSRIWNPAMSKTARFVLIQRPASINPQPKDFASLAGMAGYIHACRGKRALKLLDAALPFEGEDAPRQGVAVWAVDTFGDSTEYLGWAWLDGAKRWQLASALETVQPQRARYTEAA